MPPMPPSQDQGAAAMDTSQQQENIDLDRAPPATDLPTATATATATDTTPSSRAFKSPVGLNASVKRPSAADHTPHRPHAPDMPSPKLSMSLSAAGVLGFGANSPSSTASRRHTPGPPPSEDQTPIQAHAQAKTFPLSPPSPAVAAAMNGGRRSSSLASNDHGTPTHGTGNGNTNGNPMHTDIPASNMIGPPATPRASAAATLASASSSNQAASGSPAAAAQAVQATAPNTPDASRDQSTPGQDDDAFIHNPFVSNSPPIPTAMANRKPAFSIPEFPAGYIPEQESKADLGTPASPPISTALGNCEPAIPEFPDPLTNAQESTLDCTVPASPPIPTAMPNRKPAFSVPEFPEGHMNKHKQEPKADPVAPASPVIPTAVAGRKSAFSIPEFPDSHVVEQETTASHVAPVSPPIPTAMANRKPTFSVPGFLDSLESKVGHIEPVSPPIPTMAGRKPAFSVPEFPDSHTAEQNSTADEHKNEDEQVAEPLAHVQETPRQHGPNPSHQATPSTLTARRPATRDFPHAKLTTPTSSAHPTPSKPQTFTLFTPRAPASTTSFKRTPSASSHLILSARKSSSRLSIQPTEQPSAVKKHSIVALTRAAAAGAFKGPGSPSAASAGTPGKAPATPAYRRVQEAGAEATPRRAMSPGPLEAIERALKEDMEEEIGHDQTLDRVSEGSETKSGESDVPRIEDVTDQVREAREQELANADAVEPMDVDQGLQQADATEQAPEFERIHETEPAQHAVDGTNMQQDETVVSHADDHEVQQDKIAELTPDENERQQDETAKSTAQEHTSGTYTSMRAAPTSAFAQPAAAAPVVSTPQSSTPYRATAATIGHATSTPAKSAAAPRPLAVIMSSFNALRSSPSRALAAQTSTPASMKPLASETQQPALDPQEAISAPQETSPTPHDAPTTDEPAIGATAASAEPQAPPASQETPAAASSQSEASAFDLHAQLGADTPDTDAGTPLRSASSVFAHASFASSPTPAAIERVQSAASAQFTAVPASAPQSVLAQSQYTVVTERGHTVDGMSLKLVHDMAMSTGLPGLPSRDALHAGQGHQEKEQQFGEVQAPQLDQQSDLNIKAVSTPPKEQQYELRSETAMRTSPMPLVPSTPLPSPRELASIAIQAHETPKSPMSRVQYTERDLERAREELTQDYDAILLAEMNKRDAELEALTAECQRLEKEQNDSVAIIQEADTSLQKLESDLAHAQSQLTHERHMRAAAEAEAARERRDRNDQVSGLQAKYDQLETEYMRVRVNLQDVTGERDELKRKTMDDAVTITSMLADLKKSEEQAREVRDYARQRLEVANMEVAKCHQTYRLEMGGLRGQLQVALSEKQAAEARAREAATRVQELEAIAEELLELVGGQVKENERKWVEYFSAQVPLPPAGMDDGEDEDL